MGQEYLALLAYCDPVIVVLYPDKAHHAGTVVCTRPAVFDE